MKLVIAIINNDDSSIVLSELTEKGFFVTKLSSTGGFLKRGNTTILLGVEDDKVNDCIQIINDNAHKRVISEPVISPRDMSDIMSPMMVDVSVGGATIFVLPIESYIKV